MTTDQLLAVLNEEAERLASAPVTRRILRDWVDEGLLTPRTAKGRRRAVNPIWHFSESDGRWATKIVELKAANIHRVAELRLHLWVSDDSYPIDAVAEALRSEFKRLMHRDRRTQRSKFDHRHQKGLTEAEVQRYFSQLPPLDSGLASIGFEISPKSATEMISELRWGRAGTEKFSRLMIEEAARILGISSDQIKSQLDVSNLAGLFGAMDEIDDSGEEGLIHVTDTDLLEARRRFRDFISSLSSEPRNQHPELLYAAHEYRRAMAAFKRTEWTVSQLAAFAFQAYRTRAEPKRPPVPG
jgi:hypothetical protein